MREWVYVMSAVFLLGCGRAGYTDEPTPELHDDTLAEGQGTGADPLTGHAGGPCQGVSLGDGLLEVDDTCLRYSANALSFWGAQRECLDQGGTLWIPDGNKESAFRQLSSEDVWTGLHFYTGSNPTGWYTVAGEPVAYSPWAPGEPASPSGDAGVSTTAGWTSIDRTTGTYPYVCEFRPWTRIGDREFFSALASGTWQSNRGHCVTSNAELASLDTPLAYAELSSKLRLDMWLHIREDIDGTYRWGSGEDIDPALWEAGGPVPGQGCARLGRLGLLESASCGAAATGFVCERAAR